MEQTVESESKRIEFEVETEEEVEIKFQKPVQPRSFDHHSRLRRVAK